MPSFLTVLSFASLGLALTVTKPGKFDLWDSGKSNTIEWTSVNTDPSNFDIYLSHMASHPPLNSLLFANVPKEQASAVVSGLQLPSGDAYQINLVAHDKPEQIYAQSQQFNVTGEAVAATSTLDGYTGPTYTPTASDKTTMTTASTSGAAAGATGSHTTSSGTATSTSTRTSSGSNSTSSSSDTTASGASAASGSARPTQSGNAAAGTVASAPLAALIFGAAAFFL